MSEPKHTPGEPPTFELRTVADFMAVPPEKLDACLMDFRAWLDMIRGAVALVAEYPALQLKHAPDMFGWIDDGKHIATVTVEAGGQIISRDELEFAPPEAAGHE